MDINPREAAAFDAVIAYSLVGRKYWELPDEDIEKELADYPPLESEGKAILEAMGNSPFSEQRVARERKKADSFEVCGTYRDGSDDKLSPELREEIARKREEIRVRLREKSEPNV